MFEIRSSSPHSNQKHPNSDPNSSPKHQHCNYQRISQTLPMIFFIQENPQTSENSRPPPPVSSGGLVFRRLPYQWQTHPQEVFGHNSASWKRILKVLEGKYFFVLCLFAIDCFCSSVCVCFFWGSGGEVCRARGGGPRTVSFPNRKVALSGISRPSSPITSRTSIGFVLLGSGQTEFRPSVPSVL